jgi:hypothetical protein
MKCFVMLSLTAIDCHLCSVSFMLSAIYAQCHLCWVSFMVSFIYAEFHLCLVSSMQSSIILCVIMLFFMVPSLILVLVCLRLSVSSRVINLAKEAATVFCWEKLVAELFKCDLKFQVKVCSTWTIILSLRVLAP